MNWFEWFKKAHACLLKHKASGVFRKLFAFCLSYISRITVLKISNMTKYVIHNKTEAYSEPSRVSKVELSAINFSQKVPSSLFDWLLNALWITIGNMLSKCFFEKITENLLETKFNTFVKSFRTLWVFLFFTKFARSLTSSNN